MTTPQIGDQCMADPEVEGNFLYGEITKLEKGLAWSNLCNEFCGDTPTKKLDSVWLFDNF